MGGGTPLYRAPECALNFKRATAQADIYSVGAILHDIFGGGASRLPHVELNVPGTLGPIVQKCTKQNVRRRYPTVAALREELYAALDTAVISFSSREEAEVVSLLKGTSELTPEEWDRVFQQIDENDDKKRSNHPIFQALSLAHLRHLFDESPDLFASLGRDYAKYTMSGGFDFDYCDVIANRAEVFFEHGEMDVKALIALALLEMGVGHNRWFVERKFMKMAGPEISDALAARIAAEITVQKIDFPRLIERLERSISASRTQLHPVLRAKA
jgi:hypothetical protein